MKVLEKSKASCIIQGAAVLAIFRLRSMVDVTESIWTLDLLHDRRG